MEIDSDYIVKDIRDFAKLNNISFERAKEILEEYYKEQDEAMDEVYQDIIRSSH